MVVAERELLDLAKTIALAEYQILAPAQRCTWQPEPYQLPPDGDWDGWLFLGGRMTGKTDTMAHQFDEALGREVLRGAIVAPTLGDAVEACVNGPSGLKAHNPTIRLVGGSGGLHVYWPNGSEAKLFGAYTPEDVERLRAGGNRHLVWCEELMAWAKLEEAWNQMHLGLRLGEHPRWLASTTPKPHKLLKRLLADSNVAVTRASSDMNPHIVEARRKWLYDTYGGTRLGRQELQAEVLEDVPGALWTYAMFEERRPAPDCTRIVVAIDPSGGADPENDEQGIGAAGKGVDDRGYVLADRTCKLSPDGWARRAIQLYLDLKADLIVYEKNFGGDMVEAVIQTAARAMGVRVATKAVTASRGKRVRAEPIAALYEQGRVSHIPDEDFERLIDECCTWTPESGQSPNRLDWLVWALTELFEGGTTMFY